MRIYLYCLILLGASSACTPALAAPADKPATPVLHIEVDTTEAPDMAAWGGKAKQVITLWYPKIADFLKTDDFTPPTEIKVVFKNGQKAPAFATGDKTKTISISADHIRKHPDDIGMVVHELVHCIQCYREYKPVWLIEGIADYIRFAHFEPRTPIHLSRKSNYTDGYKTTAAFLVWIQRKYDKKIVLELNRALRNNEYKDELFEKLTGKSLEKLWREFAAQLPG